MGGGYTCPPSIHPPRKERLLWKNKEIFKNPPIHCLTSLSRCEPPDIAPIISLPAKFQAGLETSALQIYKFGAIASMFGSLQPFEEIKCNTF